MSSSICQLPRYLGNFNRSPNYFDLFRVKYIFQRVKYSLQQVKYNFTLFNIQYNSYLNVFICLKSEHMCTKPDDFRTFMK
jgi:hypothetical protein